MFVMFNGKIFNEFLIDTVIPESSVMDLIFQLFNNGLLDYINDGVVCMFADDTSILISNPTHEN